MDVDRVGSRWGAGWRGAVIAVLVCGPSALALEPPEKDDLTIEEAGEMSMEELMALQVTSLAGVGKDWFSTPAALTVITGDDVRRGGFRSIADALRMAPGVYVGATGSHGFSVGTRGFNGSLANKTLVLIDGRAVYDPLFGGTFWDVQDVMLEDLDRIEVIRGPGATLWGANAVNGVINITTKSARETQGLVITGGGGTYERAFTDARYGFALSENSWIRVYGKWFNRDKLTDNAGNSGHDDWGMTRGGFRFDHEGADDLFLTIQADAYNTDRVGEHTPAAPIPGENIQFIDDVRDVSRRGGNFLTRVGKEHERSGWAFQAYYDRTERVTNIEFEAERDTFDLDWRHHFKLGESHDLMWGLGARYTADQTEDGYNILMDKSNGSFATFAGFVQDTITLVPDHLFAMIGSKFSYDTYTGFQVQPSARLWWTPNDQHTLWASVSRPVRVPSRTENDGRLIFGYIDTGLLAGGPLSGEIIGLGLLPNDDLKAETLIAYEVGYRVQPTEELTIDTSLFFNVYDRLIYVATLVDPWNNDGSGETYGGEVSVTWRPADNWRLKAAYSYVDVHIHGPVAPIDERSTPLNQAQLQSFLDLTEDLELNAGLYYVDEVPEKLAEAYLRLDVGMTWRVTPNFELAAWGQNLLDERHKEFSDAQTEVERGFYVMGTLRF